MGQQSGMVIPDHISPMGRWAVSVSAVQTALHDECETDKFTFSTSNRAPAPSLWELQPCRVTEQPGNAQQHLRECRNCQDCGSWVLTAHSTISSHLRDTGEAACREVWDISNISFCGSCFISGFVMLGLSCWF